MLELTAEAANLQQQVQRLKGVQAKASELEVQLDEARAAAQVALMEQQDTLAKVCVGGGEGGEGRGMGPLLRKNIT